MSDDTPRPPRDLRQLVAVGALAGLVIAAGLVGWRFWAMTAEIDALEQKLTAAQSIAGDKSLQMDDLQERLESVETSAAELAKRNSELTTELATARERLDAASARPVVKFTARAVAPAVVAPSASLTLSARVQGRASKVQMKLVGPTGAPDTQVFDLVRYSTSNGVDLWQKSVTAPWKPGDYVYFATAYIGDSKFEMPGETGFTFVVK